MQWEDIPDNVQAWTSKLSSPAQALRKVAASIWTTNDVGYYLNPNTDQVALHGPMGAESDIVRCKIASTHATGQVPLFLSYQVLNDPECHWVKVAYSPTMRRAGELLNFFPGQYPGDIPNAPSPVAAMLTSGLLGAGVGYGGGKLLATMFPRRFGDKLGRTGAIAGAMLGAAPGALWSGVNASAGRPLNDPSLLSTPLENDNTELPRAMDGNNAVPLADPDAAELPDYLKGLNSRQIGQAMKAAIDMYFEKNADTFAQPYRPRARTPMDVNINALGQTLWDTEASPAMAATTMSAMYAAQQLPDPNGRPGWATGHQLGQLAQNAAGDYVRGMLVGAAINQVIGTPYSASTFGLGNMALGVVGAVVPKLFGQ